MNLRNILAAVAIVTASAFGTQADAQVKIKIGSSRNHRTQHRRPVVVRHRTVVHRRPVVVRRKTVIHRRPVVRHRTVVHHR